MPSFPGACVISGVNSVTHRKHAPRATWQGMGVLLIVVGVVFLVAGRVTWLGRLPGDILIERENVRIFIPIGTMLLLSLLLTVIVNLIARFWR
jgi:hypothetical protein